MLWYSHVHFFDLSWKNNNKNREEKSNLIQFHTETQKCTAQEVQGCQYFCHDCRTKTVRKLTEPFATGNKQVTPIAFGCIPTSEGLLH